MRIRLGRAGDLDEIARMFAALWPDGTLDDHRAEAMAIVSGSAPGAMPLVIVVAEAEGEAIGFVEVGLRSHADGCDTSHPVGFIEGWYVIPEQRGRGVGRALMEAAEEWARASGCREVASDTWADHDTSRRAHVALGFEVVDVCVHFKKRLG